MNYVYGRCLSHRLFAYFIFPCLLYCCATQAYANTTSTLLSANSLALIINDADQSSINVAEYYREVRNIPEENLIHVNIPNAKSKLNAAEFATLKANILSQLQAHHTTVLFVWTAPYAVECNSITAAFTLGFDQHH